MESIFDYFFLSDWEPELSPDKVNVWMFNLAMYKGLPDFQDCLTDDERERMSRYRLESDRLARSASRAFLRFILSEVLDVSPKEVPIVQAPGKKPMLDGVDDLHFNVSHAGDLLMIGLNAYPGIGVDVEVWKEIDFVSAARNVFSVEEQNELAAASDEDRIKLFYQGWTRKEAFIKAVGQGIAYPLKDLTVSLGGTGGDFEEIPFTSKEPRNYAMFGLTPKDGYSAALVCDPRAFNIRYQHRYIEPGDSRFPAI